MHSRYVLVCSLSLLLAAAAGAQEADTPPPADQPESAPRPAALPGTPGWKTQGVGEAEAAGRYDRTPASSIVPLRQATAGERRSITEVTKGIDALPNDHGQVWREYNIASYTTRVTSTNRPEQAIVDWILRETGYEVWHSEPLGMLSASPRALRVYHTPEIQAVVADIVDRFVASQAETQAFGLRTITIGDPNWRARVLRLMTPVPVQSQGVQGWLMAKEDAALLLAELQKRTDYREHSSPHLLVNNGQSTVISSIRPRNYVKGIILKDGTWPGYEPEIGQIEEGFALEFSPLLSLDSQSVDAIVKLRLTQVEKMLPVMLEVPTVAAPRQRTRVEVPQMSSNNLHERFRWPTDKVLLLSMGVVASPAPEKENPFTAALPLPKSPARADALLFVECKGDINGTPAARTAIRNEGGFSRRY